MPSPKRLRRQEDVDATLVASRAVIGVVARSLAEVLEHVTLPQFRVLLVLRAEHPLRSGILAERLGIHQSTFTRTADRLVANALIRREPNAQSRREVLVDLTEAGQALVADVMKVRRAEVERILGRVPARERTTIRAGFEAFAKAAGEPAASLLLTLGV